MKIPKPTEADVARFRSLVPARKGVVVKPMFGNLGAFVNGNMFMGLFGSDIGLRLDPESNAEVRAAGGGPFGPAERPMGGYSTIPSTWRKAKAQLWIDRAVTFVEAMPPKIPKRR